MSSRFGFFQRETGTGNRSGNPNSRPVLSDTRRCSNRPNSFCSPLWLSTSWKNLSAAFAPQQRKRDENALVVDHRRTSTTSGQKSSCSTRGFSALTPVTTRPSNFLSLDVAEGAVEFADMFGRRIAGLSSGRDVLHVTVRRDEAQMNLQHRVAEPKRQLPLGRDLVRHQIDDRDFERTDVLLLGADLLDRQRTAERRQKRVDLLALDNDGHCGSSN